MKTILAAFFSMIVLNCVAQDNLQYFSKAIYITLHSDKVSIYIAKDTNLTVPPDKVWKITNSKIYMVLQNSIVDDRLYLFIDEVIITFSNVRDVQASDPIWLPAGRHRLTIRFSNKEIPRGRFDFQGLISGVEYNVPK